MAGGSEAGPYVTDDSNVDWGQELPRLASWQREHMDPEDRLRLLYYGTAVPAAYGVVADPFDPADAGTRGPGTYAISTHYLAKFHHHEALGGTDMDWLDKYEPIARIGSSIYVYRFDPEPAESTHGAPRSIGGATSR